MLDGLPSVLKASPPRLKADFQSVELSEPVETLLLAVENVALKLNRYLRLSNLVVSEFPSAWKIPLAGSWHLHNSKSQFRQPILRFDYYYLIALVTYLQDKLAIIMSFVINYHKYEMFTDEEQLIYEDDDDVEWEDEVPSLDASSLEASTESRRKNEQIAIGDSLDHAYFLDRTLSSISTPENKIWDLRTTTGYALSSFYLVLFDSRSHNIFISH